MSRYISNLAPAPLPITEGALTARNNLSSSATVSSGIKRASIACQSCKQIKRKCDQRQPCSNCVKAGQACIYDQTQDGRRRAARKRNVEELEQKRDALATILDAFRDANDDNVQELLQLIRSCVPLHEIVHFASTCSDDIPEDQLAELAVIRNATQPRKPVLSINALVDETPIRVPARPWTNVTNDDELISHLVSIYFTWAHSVHPALVQDLFVEHMAAGDLKSQFCSPILVSSICALACQISDHPEAFTVSGDNTSRGRAFLEEAMSLWTEQAARPSLTALQAGQPLALALITTGKDRISTAYIDQMDDFAPDLLYIAQRDDLATKDLNAYKSLCLAIWSLYGITVEHSIAFMRSRICATPAIEQLVATDICFQSESVWYPYPDSEPEMPANTGEYAVYQYELDSLGAAISSFLFGAEQESSTISQGLANLDNRLKIMTHNIPQADDVDTIDPNLMNVNLNCYWLSITLFSFFQSAGAPKVESWSNGSFTMYARDQCIQAIRRIASLCRQYIRQYGLQTLAFSMPQTAVSAAYVLVDNLKDPEAQDLFHEMCLIVTTAARKSNLMRGQARMLFITAEQNRQIIHERTRRLLEPIAPSSWWPDSHKFFETSRFPNYALARGKDPRSATMGNLLSRWKHFHCNSIQSDTTPAVELDRARNRFAHGPGSVDRMHGTINESNKVSRT